MAKYLSISQLADRWSPIGKTTIRRLIARGLLKGLRVGEKVLVEIEGDRLLGMTWRTA